MKKLLIIIVVFISCNLNNNSKVVAHKLNKDSLNTVLKGFTLINIDTTAQSDFYYTYNYKSNTDSTLIRILFDSLKNISGINKNKNEVNLFVAEYYTNGQIKGDVPLNKDGEVDGLATYYYEDGRLRRLGYWKRNLQVGEWKEYDKNRTPVKNK